MKITIDHDKCCGAGTCVLLAPDVFDQRDDDGIVILLDERPSAELHPVVVMPPTSAPERRSS